MNDLSRRDFLKLIITIPSGMTLLEILPQLGTSSSQSSNVIVIVLDALTARNMSLYGYPRKTTPNIERFAARSDVYHAHHSSGTFTSSGVASILTGTYPWTHRAVHLAGLIARDRFRNNIFNLLDPNFTSIAFTQNYFADYILSQIKDDITRHLSIGSWSDLELYSSNVTGKNHLLKFRALDDFLFGMEPNTPASLIFGTINKHRKTVLAQKKTRDHLQYYSNELFYDINSVFSGLVSQLVDLKSPSLCYFHLYPPHGPYLPSENFLNLFQDNWQPIEKAGHPLVYKEPQKALNKARTIYDQYLAMTDAALGHFLDEIDKAGLLKNSYLILTSDHGESFERGYWAHIGPLVYEPSIHVPLLISSPGQSTQRNFYSVTSSVDLVPTLLKILDLEVPSWCEGTILPGYGKEIDHNRPVFSMDAKNSSAFSSLTPITIAMCQGDYKLIYYKGYKDEQSEYYKGVFELYNLAEDPEELKDLINDEPKIAKKMKELVLESYNEANIPPSQM